MAGRTAHAIHRTVLLTGALSGLLATIAASQPVLAQEWSLYGAVRGGLALPGEREVTVTHPALTQPVQTDIDLSAGGRAEIGIGFQMDQFRAEIAGDYGRDPIDSTSVETPSGTVTLPVDGGIDSFSGFFNGAVDIPLGDGFVPHVGAGVGYTYQDSEADSDGALAFQVTAGMGIALTDRLALDIDYRYRRQGETRFEDGATTLLQDNGNSHAIMAGLRFHFFGAPPETLEHGLFVTPIKSADPGGAAGTRLAHALQTDEDTGTDRSSYAPGLRTAGNDAAETTSGGAGGTVAVRPDLSGTVPTGGSGPVTGSPGRFSAQLASYSKQANAERGWNTLRKRHGDLLGGLNHRIVPADLPGKGRFYRLYATGLGRGQGEALCRTLKSRGAGCLVAEPR